MKMIQHNIKPHLNIYACAKSGFHQQWWLFNNDDNNSHDPTRPHQSVSDHIRRFFDRSSVITPMINKGCSTGSFKMTSQAMPGLFTFPLSVYCAVPRLRWRPEDAHPTSIQAVVMFCDCDCVWISVFL